MSYPKEPEDMAQKKPNNNYPDRISFKYNFLENLSKSVPINRLSVPGLDLNIAYFKRSFTLEKVLLFSRNILDLGFRRFRVDLNLVKTLSENSTFEWTFCSQPPASSLPWSNETIHPDVFSEYPNMTAMDLERKFQENHQLMLDGSICAKGNEFHMDTFLRNILDDPNAPSLLVFSWRLHVINGTALKPFPDLHPINLVRPPPVMEQWPSSNRSVVFLQDITSSIEYDPSIMNGTMLGPPSKRNQSLETFWQSIVANESMLEDKKMIFKSLLELHDSKDFEPMVEVQEKSIDLALDLGINPILLKIPRAKLNYHLWGWSEMEPKTFLYQNTFFGNFKSSKTLPSSSCVVMDLNYGMGHWVTGTSCDESRIYSACRRRVFDRYDNETWRISLESGFDAECPKGYEFAVPKTSFENTLLYLYLSVSLNEGNYSTSLASVFLPINDVDRIGCWVIGNVKVKCPYPNANDPGISQEAIITMSVVGGVVVLLLMSFYGIYLWHRDRKWLAHRVKQGEVEELVKQADMPPTFPI